MPSVRAALRRWSTLDAVSSPVDRESEAHRAAILEANQAFYAAFEALDLEAMAALWAAHDPVSCIHPGWAMLVGRQAVLSSWAGIFRGTQAMRFDLRDPQVFVAGTSALVVLFEIIEARLHDEHIRAVAHTTNVFVLELGAWRIVHHHASPSSADALPVASGRAIH